MRNFLRFSMILGASCKVDLIQSVIGPAAKTMGWPNEPICKQ